MRKGTAIYCLASALLVIVLSGPGCEGSVGSSPIAQAGSGGAATTSSSSTDQPTGGGRCHTPADDYCDSPADCACTECERAAGCVAGGCVADEFCSLDFEDSCTCSDCDWSPPCIDFDGTRCNHDGACDFQVESCACADCDDVPTCLDNLAQCGGGVRDGLCDLAVETCLCSDCLGSMTCLCGDDQTCPCVGDDGCPLCLCPACWAEPECSDPDSCLDEDGVCDFPWSLEGCQCPDCADLPPCQGFPG